jgi:hypothetical protein
MHVFGYANGNPLAFIDFLGERAATKEEALELALWERSANNYRDEYQGMGQARQFLSRQLSMWGGAYGNWKLLEEHVARRRAAIDAAAGGQEVEAVLGFDPNLTPLPESRSVELTGGGTSASFIVFAKYQAVPKRDPNADALAMVMLSPPSALRAIVGDAFGETEKSRNRAVMMNGGPWLLTTLLFAPVESSSRDLLPAKLPQRTGTYINLAERAPPVAEAVPPELPARLEYMGSTPGKGSRTGREVVERMQNEGALRFGEEGVEVLHQDPQTGGRTWVPLRETDMSHVVDAVTWWNRVGRQFGPRAPEVRRFMLDPRNYTLLPSSVNRSAGARLRETYQPPAKPVISKDP